MATGPINKVNEATNMEKDGDCSCEESSRGPANDLFNVAGNDNCASNPPPVPRRIVRARRPAFITNDPSTSGRVSALIDASNPLFFTTGDGTISSSVPTMSPTFAIGVGGEGDVVVGTTGATDSTNRPKYRTLRRRAMRAIQHGGGRNGARSSATIGAGNVNRASEIENTDNDAREATRIQRTIQIENSANGEALSSLHGTVASAGVVERVTNVTNSVSDDDCDDDTEEFGNAATDLDSLGRDGNRFGVLGSAGHDSSSSDEEESCDESVENHDDYISIDGSGDTYEEESDDDDDNPFLAMPQFFEMFGPHGPRPRAPQPLDPQSSNIRPDNDAEESDDEIDSSAARCAACFRVGNQNHKWRRLVTLPCCGAYGRESNSSTRFCAGCVLKLAVTRADSSNSDEYHTYDDERDDYPVKKFYKESEQTDNRRFIQCPRCRDVLLVRIKGVKSSNDDEASDSDSSPCDCSTCKAERLNKSPKTAKAISVHAPTFMAKCLYFGRKKGGAELLWKVSLLHHNFLSYKVLGGDEEALIPKLVGCGIIERIPGGMNKNVYRIDKKNQASLIRFFHLNEPTEEESVSQFKLTLDLAMSLVFATWGHLKDEYRIDRSLRCINRVCFLALHKFGFLPPLPLYWWQELVVNLLVAYSAILASQFLCILVAYALVFVSVGLSVCYVLKRSNNIKSIWWQTIIASYFVFTVCTYFWWSPFPSWRLFPNATTAVKKLVSWVFNNVVIAPQKVLGYVWSIKAMDEHGFYLGFYCWQVLRF